MALHYERKHSKHDALKSRASYHRAQAARAEQEQVQEQHENQERIEAGCHRVT
jgi:hypothetical protein